MLLSFFIMEVIPSRTKTQDDSSLTAEDKEKLKRQDNRLVTSFQAEKLEIGASKYWDQFYKRNTIKFFKDRHWTTREFYELVEDKNFEKKDKFTILELGCGVGNLVFPLLEEKSDMEIFACDFSPRAIELMKENKLYDPKKLHLFVADITQDDLLTKIEVQVDIVTAVFVLSAIHPDNFVNTIKNIYRVLKPGGFVLIRDYGLYDMTQIRFKPGHKISDNFYMRQDGTRSYFFKNNELRHLFLKENFEEIACSYIKSRTVNIKESVDVPRTFVQAKFKKICKKIS